MKKTSPLLQTAKLLPGEVDVGLFFHLHKRLTNVQFACTRCRYILKYMHFSSTIIMQKFSVWKKYQVLGSSCTHKSCIWKIHGSRFEYALFKTCPLLDKKGVLKLLFGRFVLGLFQVENIWIDLNKKCCIRLLFCAIIGAIV